MAVQPLADILAGPKHQPFLDSIDFIGDCILNPHKRVDKFKITITFQKLWIREEDVPKVGNLFYDTIKERHIHEVSNLFEDVEITFINEPYQCEPILRQFGKAIEENNFAFSHVTVELGLIYKSEIQFEDPRYSIKCKPLTERGDQLFFW